MKQRSRKIIHSMLPLIMVVLIGGCSSERRGQVLQKRMSVVETLVIGEYSDSYRNGPPLSYIREAVTDSSGNIFLVDGGTMKIDAYGPDGIHRWSRGGEGPSLLQDHASHPYSKGPSVSLQERDSILAWPFRLLY